MERFVKLNKQVKDNLLKICRLCGIDNPNKIGILEEVVFLSDDGDIEPPLYKKIFNCVGIQVTPSDQMPKTVCALCFDKINDFYEFREMCYVTNLQTRKLLGLSEQPKFEPKWEPADTVENVDSSENKKEKPEKKGKKRKNAEPPPDILPKQIKIESSTNDPIKSEIKTEDDGLANKLNKKLKGKLDKTISLKPLEPKGKLGTKKKQDKMDKTVVSKPETNKIVCQVCKMPFVTAPLLQSHLLKWHVPRVHQYFCVKCDEGLNNKMEIKSHNLWHKMSKTPFECGRCGKNINSLQHLTKHTMKCPLAAAGKSTIILPNVVCKSCSVEFCTLNLFYMHPCVTKSLCCPKCKCKLSSKANTLKHIASCNAKVQNEVQNEGYVIKTEPVEEDQQKILTLSTIESDFKLSVLPEPSVSKSKSVKNSMQTTVPVSSSQISKDIENSNTMVVIPSSSSSDKDTIANKRKSSNEIESGESKSKGQKKKKKDIMDRCSYLLQDAMRTMVNIKHEPIDPSALQEADESYTIESDEGEISIENFPPPQVKLEILDETYKEIESNGEINIKQEVVSYPTIDEPTMPALKLKIKLEHGTLNSSFIENSITAKNRKEKSSNIEETTEETNANKLNEDEQRMLPLDDESDLSLHKETHSLQINNLGFAKSIKAEPLDSDNEHADNDNMNDYTDDFQNDDDYDSDNQNERDHTLNSELPVVSNICSEPDSFNNIENEKVAQSHNEASNIKNTETAPFLRIASVSERIDVFDNLRNANKNEVNQTNLDTFDFPKIASVSSGVDLSLYNLSANDNQSEQSFKIPQISNISSGVILGNPTSSQDFESFYYNVNVKQEPVDEENSQPNEHNDDDTNEPNNGVLEENYDQFAAEGETSDLEDTEYNGIKKSYDRKQKRTPKAKKKKKNPNKSAEVINHVHYQMNEDSNSQISSLDEENDNERVENSSPLITNVFDPNIKIKQEIEFSEETFLEDDQYEYCSDNDENDNFENQCKNNDINNRLVKTPSPVRELQPIVMNLNVNQNFVSNTELTKILVDDKEDKQKINESQESNTGHNENLVSQEETTSNCGNLNTFNSDISEINSDSFAFKKIKLKMQTPNRCNRNSTEDATPEINQQKSDIGLRIASVEHLSNSNNDSSEQSILATSSDQITIRLPKLENINEIAENHNNENFEKLLRSEFTDEIQEPEAQIQTSPLVIAHVSSAADRISCDLTKTNDCEENPIEHQNKDQ